MVFERAYKAQKIKFSIKDFFIFDDRKIDQSFFSVLVQSKTILNGLGSLLRFTIHEKVYYSWDTFKVYYSWDTLTPYVALP